MPNVRLSIQLLLSARLILLIITTAVALATAVLVCVEPPAASACPMVMPKPLRALYQESDLVAVVRVGEFVAVETPNGAPLQKSALHISSLLKGESRKKVVDLYHYAWEEDASSPRAFAKDDVLLVFLKPHEKGDGYFPADFDRGVKKLSPDELKVYVRRIEELAVIMRGEKPDEAALTEWLVRCAEEPATRWEGAYELAFNALLPEDPQADGASSGTVAANAEPAIEEVKTDEDKAEAEGDAVEPPATGADQVSDNEGGNEKKVEVIPSSQTEEQIDFAALLTPTHKERLMLTLLNAEELEWAEQMLLRLVGSWKDERLVPFSLKHLARMADQPLYHAEDLMRVVAHTYSDATLIKFVADYSKTAAYEDLYDNGADDDEVEGETDAERAADRKEIEEMKAAAAEARFQRSGKLHHFLALADQPQKP